MVDPSLEAMKMLTEGFEPARIPSSNNQAWKLRPAQMSLVDTRMLKTKEKNTRPRDHPAEYPAPR